MPSNFARLVNDIIHHLMEKRNYDASYLRGILEILGRDVISEIIKQDDRLLWPIMHLAAERHPLCIPVLLDCLDVGVARGLLLSKDHRGFTCLHQVAVNQGISPEDKKIIIDRIVGMLGEDEACKLVLGNGFGDTPTHINMGIDVDRIAKELKELGVTTALARLNQPNVFGMTPVHFAALYCPYFFRWFPTFLSRKKANPEEYALWNRMLLQPNILGDIPLHLAVQCNVQAMLEMQASSPTEQSALFTSMINVHNRFGKTPLHLLLCSYNYRFLRQILPCISKTHEIVDDFAQPDPTGQNLLHLAAQKDADIAHFMLGFLGDDAARLVTAHDTNGFTPLHFVARSNPSVLLQMMQQLDGQADMQAFYNNAATVRLLCEMLCDSKDTLSIPQFIALLPKDLTPEVAKAVKDVFFAHNFNLLHLALNSKNADDVTKVLNLFELKEAENLAIAVLSGSDHALTLFMHPEAPHYAVMFKWFSDRSINIKNRFAEDDERLKSLCRSICDRVSDGRGRVVPATSDAVKFVVTGFLSLHRELGDRGGDAMLNMLQGRGVNLLCLIAQYCPETDVRNVLDCFSPAKALELATSHDRLNAFPASIMAKYCFGNLMNMIAWFSEKRGTDIISLVASNRDSLKSFCEAVSKNKEVKPQFILHLAIKTFQQLGPTRITLMQNAFGRLLNLQSLFSQCEDKSIAKNLLPIAVHIGDRGAVVDILGFLSSRCPTPEQIELLQEVRDSIGKGGAGAGAFFGKSSPQAEFIALIDQQIADLKPQKCAKSDDPGKSDGPK